jgi:3',5'-cyclic AMP phosphodiesterase CpdA
VSLAGQKNTVSGPQLPIRIGHISDLHFGRIADPDILEALYADLHGSDLDLIIVSGDLTQRAFPWQYRDAAKFLNRMEIPWLVVPGNHDVFPWWRPFLRLTDPLRRFRKWISEDMNPHIHWKNLAVLGINSAFGLTVQGGRIDSSDRDQMEGFFSSVSDSSFRILVVHHHLTQLDTLHDHDIARGAEETLKCAADLRVGMVLCGHLHISHVTHLENISPGHSIIICTAGTSTSDRGRGVDPVSNFYNQITVDQGHIDIEERKYNPAKSVFEAASISTYPRVRE